MNRLLLWTSLAFVLVGADRDQDQTEWCIDSKFHKKQPSAEDSLHSQCEPWKSYSCCNQETTVRSHNAVNQYKFDINHCPQHPMSDKCRQHFHKDLCFYECEPYVKPWVVQVNRSFATQRIYKVPICANDCQMWWNDCRDDYTCVANWAREFEWKNKTNICPANSPCLPLNKIYTNAQQFCEMVWDHSWQYTPEEKPCMRMWFGNNEKDGNPNKATALYYASQPKPNGGQTLVSVNAVLYALTLAIAFISNLF